MRRWIFWSGMVALALLVVAIATRRVGVERRLMRPVEACGCNCNDCVAYERVDMDFDDCDPGMCGEVGIGDWSDKCGNRLELWCKWGSDPQIKCSGCCGYKLYYNGILIAQCPYYGGLNQGYFYYSSGRCRITEVYWKTCDDCNSGSCDDNRNGKYDWQYWEYDPCMNRLCRHCCEHPTSYEDQNCQDSTCECGPASW